MRIRQMSSVHQTNRRAGLAPSPLGLYLLQELGVAYEEIATCYSVHRHQYVISLSLSSIYSGPDSLAVPIARSWFSVATDSSLVM